SYVCIVKFLPLNPVYALCFTQKVSLHTFYTLDAQQVFRIDGTFSQRLSGNHFIADGHLHSSIVWHGVYALFDIALDDDFMFILGVSVLLINPVYFSNNGLSFWMSRYQKLLSTRPCLCNIIASYTSGMQRSYCQLRSWLTY